MDQKKVTAASWSTGPINHLSLTPLDGRNYHKISQLSEYFSEFAITKARLTIEVEYLLFLIKQGIAGKLDYVTQEKIRNIYRDFDQLAMDEVKDWETETNHDVKAVEYYLKDQLKLMELEKWIEMVHWGLTSEDVSNLAFNICLRDFLTNEQLPIIRSVIKNLSQLISNSDHLMLGRTHGQPAGVTTMAKELSVYLDRLIDEYQVLSNIKLYGKVAGVIGTLADQKLAYKNKNWQQLTAEFVKQFGFEPATAVIQVVPYDSMIRVFDSLTRMQNIALDLLKNLWWYVSLDYFVQAKKPKEVGSSTLPHKINPIYMEGAEGGFELANSIFELYRRELSQSRLQRDLSDSTIRRSLGVAFGYTFLSWQSVVEALSRITPNQSAMLEDLDKHWEVMTGPVQNWLKVKGYQKPYEKLLKKTRGQQLNKSAYEGLIKSLDLKKTHEKKLLSLTFKDLTGEIPAIVRAVTQKAERILNNQNSLAVVGTQWGDEGKGKLIDFFGEKFQTTVRYNGGNNAGHTVKVGKTVLHMSLIPSAVLHKKQVMISHAVVIDPLILINEIKMLKKLGINPKLMVDHRCHVVLPYHKEMDAASEWYKGKKKTGSLKLGIGFTYEDRTNRAGVRMKDLIDSKRLEQAVKNQWKLKELRVTKAYGAKFGAKLQDTIKEYTQYGKFLAEYVGDVSEYVRNNIEQESMLFESAQGAFLDFAFGSYPYTVAYHTIAPSIMADVGMPARKIRVAGIVKAYTTRVGNGPFLAEQDNELGEYMRKRGGEFGTVSGRPRRCGWLDLPMIKTAVEINGITEITLTKLDVLSGMDEIKVVTHYLKNGKTTHTPPTDDVEAEGMKPVYETFAGWSDEILDVAEYDNLPIEARAYIRYIEDAVGVKINLVSVGPDRKQTISKPIL